MHEPPPITIRKLPGIEAWGAWGWKCSNGYCPHRRSSGYSSQPAALRNACLHLATAFEQHHAMIEIRPYWSESEGRYITTCRCGYEAQEKTEQGAEDSLYSHIDWLRQELPKAAA